MSKKRNFKRKTIKPYYHKSDEFSTDSDSHFSFIAGYTDSGVPFGLTWEEYNPNLNDIDDHSEQKINQLQYRNEANHTN